MLCSVGWKNKGKGGGCTRLQAKTESNMNIEVRASPVGGKMCLVLSVSCFDS